MPLAGILLAAGASSRFGANKLLHPLPAATPAGAPPGTPIAVASALAMLAVLPGTVAVVRSANSEVARRLRAAGCRIAVCRRAAEGMGHSLAAGVRASGDASGWIVGLADMPFVRPETIRMLATSLVEGAAIAAPELGGRRGNPVGFARRFKDDLRACEGDAGARGILRAHPDWITLHEVDDPGVLRDIDRPGDLAAE